MNSRMIPALAVVVVSALLPVSLLAATVHAASQPTCSGGRWTVVQEGYDKHRAYVDCTSISSTTKVRPKLKRDFQSDIEGSWFTTTNVTKYTAYAECPFGCSGGWDWAAR